jgi:hypothetical protein
MQGKCSHFGKNVSSTKSAWDRDWGHSVPLIRSQDRWMLSSMLNFDQLQVAVAAAKRQFDLIRKKHPNLKAYLVMSLPGGQTGIDSSPTQILSEFPAMVVDDGVKTNALNLLSLLKFVKPDAPTVPEAERLRKQVDQLAPQLEYDEKIQVEIRFNDLEFDLVWKLQADDLVDRNLTPQTKGSIQIVLGTLAQFAGTHHEH